VVTPYHEEREVAKTTKNMPGNAFASFAGFASFALYAVDSSFVR
jgi:hypothetical protein